MNYYFEIRDYFRYYHCDISCPCYTIAVES